MSGYVFSPSQLAFYAAILKPSYEQTGSWPVDGVEISDQVWAQYAAVAPPAGKKLGADADGQPIWVDLPAPPPPSLAQRAAAMLATGIEIVSTGNPSLNGTYPCDEQTSNQESGLLVAIVAGLTLPNGVAVRVDTSGNPHAFTPAEFRDYCQAKLIYTQVLTTIIGNNQGELPEQPTVIA